MLVYKVGMDANRKTFIPLSAMARRLGLPAAWIKAEAGQLPFLRANRRLMFNPEAVERALLKRITGDKHTHTGEAVALG